MNSASSHLLIYLLGDFINNNSNFADNKLAERYVTFLSIGLKHQKKKNVHLY